MIVAEEIGWKAVAMRHRTRLLYTESIDLCEFHQLELRSFLKVTKR